MDKSRDSVHKVITSYFAAVTSETFQYRGQVYRPRRLVVHPTLFRGYECPAGCGGCCSNHSLDYVPTEPLPESAAQWFEPRQIDFNGGQVTVLTDDNRHHANADGGKCRNLLLENGRCGIHEDGNPLSCSFELLKFLHHSKPLPPVRPRHSDLILADRPPPPVDFTTRLFARGWKMRRVDGQRGALCSITPASQDNVPGILAQLRRLQVWTDHFGLQTKIPRLLDWCQTVRTGSQTF